MRTTNTRKRRTATQTVWRKTGSDCPNGTCEDEEQPGRSRHSFADLDVTGVWPGRICDLEAMDESRFGEESPGRMDPRQPLAGGAATIVCNGRGGYRVAMNGWAGATCGIAGCVRRHEESHATDWRRRWPEGCKDKADGAQIPLGGDGYDAFLRTSECTAYGVEENCIVPLYNAARRDSTACETTLRDHLADTRTQKASYC
jgi:hypothetical protein